MLIVPLTLVSGNFDYSSPLDQRYNVTAEIAQKPGTLLTSAPLPDSQKFARPRRASENPPSPSPAPSPGHKKALTIGVPIDLSDGEDDDECSHPHYPSQSTLLEGGDVAVAAAVGLRQTLFLAQVCGFSVGDDLREEAVKAVVERMALMLSVEDEGKRGGRVVMPEVGVAVTGRGWAGRWGD